MKNENPRARGFFCFTLVGNPAIKHIAGGFGLQKLKIVREKKFRKNGVHVVATPDCHIFVKYKGGLSSPNNPEQAVVSYMDRIAEGIMNAPEFSALIIEEEDIQECFSRYLGKIVAVAHSCYFRSIQVSEGAYEQP